MPIFSKNGKNIMFIHIPKTAGSSIGLASRKLGWDESFSIRGKSLEEIKFFKASLQHLHAEPLQSILNLDEFDLIFTIVRNPFDRLRSAYYWQLHQKITNLDVDSWISDTFENYHNNPYLNDNHIRPQIDFIIDYNENFEILKIEEDGVNNAIRLISNLTSSSSWEPFLPPEKCSSVIRSVQEKKSKRNSDVEVKFLNNYDRIVDFYRKDYAAFSYKI